MEDTSNQQQCKERQFAFSRTAEENRMQTVPSRRQSSEYDDMSYKRDLESRVGSIEGAKKRLRDASQPLSSQTTFHNDKVYANSKAESGSLRTSPSPNNVIASSFEEKNSTTRKNSVTIYENNSSRTAPFDMTLSREPAMAEKPTNLFCSPQPEVQHPSFCFPAVAKNNEHSGIENSSVHLSPVETVFQSPTFSQWSWNDVRHNNSVITYPNDHYLNPGQEVYGSSAPMQHPAYLFGHHFQNSTQTQAYPVILQYPFPYVFPSAPGFPHLAKENVVQLPFQSRYDTQCYPSMDPKIPETTLSLYNMESKNTDSWRTDAIVESKPIVSMISNESPKNTESQQVTLKVNEDKFAAVTSPFLRKLLFIVEQTDTQHLCSWTRSGRSFVVWHPIRFENEVLPKYYKHSNFSSFVRQLNQYGFHKLHPEAWEFGHPLFVRNRVDLILRICRRPSRRLKKQTDIHQGEARTEEQVNQPDSRQNSEAENVVDNGLSPSVSIIDNDENTLEETFVEWSQEEDKEESKDTQELIKNLSPETMQMSPRNKFQASSDEAVNISKEKSTELTELQRNDVEIPCVFRILENIYARLNSIQEEVSQMQTKIESFQEILKTLSPFSKTVSSEHDME